MKPHIITQGILRGGGDKTCLDCGYILKEVQCDLLMELRGQRRERGVELNSMMWDMVPYEGHVLCTLLKNIVRSWMGKSDIKAHSNVLTFLFLKQEINLPMIRFYL